MTRPRLAVAFSAGAVALLALVGLGAWQFYWRGPLEARRAIELVGALQNPDVVWNDDLRARLELPVAVFTKDEAVKHILGSVVDRWPKYATRQLYMMGLYMLDKDCEQSIHYQRLYSSRRGGDDQSRELLRISIADGCDAAGKWLLDRSQPERQNAARE